MTNHHKTTDHRYIKSWAAARGGIPTRLRMNDRDTDQIGLHIHFPKVQENSDHLQRLTWQTFFDIFTNAQLALLYDDDMDSNYHEFVQRG